MYIIEAIEYESNVLIEALKGKNFVRVHVNGV